MARRLQINQFYRHYRSDAGAAELLSQQNSDVCSIQQPSVTRGFLEPRLTGFQTHQKTVIFAFPISHESKGLIFMLLNVSSGTDYHRKAFSTSITKVEREPFGHLPNMFSAKLSCPLVHLFFFFTRSYGPVVKICKVFTSRTTHLSAFVLILEVVLS